MNVGSLFSGIGGIELGFERAGFRTKWFVENDLYCQAVLRKQFPRAIIYGNVEDVDFRTVQKVYGILLGFPCQDISNAGKGAGIEGSRSGLWKYGLQAIRIIRPEFALIENVSAIINRGLNVVLADLAEIGYDAEWHCISASSVGAPHRRDRIFIISYPDRSSDDVSNSLCRRRDWKQCKESIQEKKIELSSRGGWAIEPAPGRVADGVPNRVERIKCLGNAVVPQCAEVFAQAIKGIIEGEGGR